MPASHATFRGRTSVGRHFLRESPPSAGDSRLGLRGQRPHPSPDRAPVRDRGETEGGAWRLIFGEQAVQFTLLEGAQRDGRCGQEQEGKSGVGSGRGEFSTAPASIYVCVGRE